MKTTTRWMTGLALTAGALIGSMFLAGCEVGDASTVNRNVGVDFTGLYRNSDGRIVAKNSGAAITQFDLRQSGDRLELIDNNGIIFKGSIGDVQDSVGSFNVNGKTSSGVDATISGNLRKTGDTTAEMSGTWIEPNLYSTVFATANVAPTPTNNPVVTNTNALTLGSIRVLSPSEWLAMRQAAQQRLWFLQDA